MNVHGHINEFPTLEEYVDAAIVGFNVDGIPYRIPEPEKPYQCKGGCGMPFDCTNVKTEKNPSVRRELRSNFTAQKIDNYNTCRKCRRTFYGKKCSSKKCSSKKRS